MRSLKAIFNEAVLQKFSHAARDAKLGNLLGNTPITRVLTVSSNVGVLPDNAKARVILACRSTVGTTKANLTVSNLATPTTGLVGRNVVGDILFAAADAVTECEVTYLPYEGDVFEEVIPVVAATGIGTLLNSRRGCILLSATALTGTTVGAETVILRGGTVATTQACLTDGGTTVAFYASDAVTSARVKYIEHPALGVSGALRNETSNL
jgi:hypothetical protein